jgi:hypothetical protein
VKSELSRKPQISPLRAPGFPVGIGGVGELHAAFLTESRTRGRFQCKVAGNPGNASVEVTTFWVCDDPFSMQNPLHLGNKLVISTEA